MSTAAAKVFSVAELLENILVNIDPIKLFVVRRVNHAFAEATDRSSVLQRKMLLISNADAYDLKSVDEEDVMLSLNPPLFGCSNTTQLAPISLNNGGLGLLKQFKDYWISHVHHTSTDDGRPVVRGFLHVHGMMLPNDPDVEMLKLNTPSCHEFQSWKSMQISSIPCQFWLEAKFYRGRSDDDQLYCKYGWLEAGSTMEDLVDLLARTFPLFSAYEENARVRDRQPISIGPDHPVFRWIGD